MAKDMFTDLLARCFSCSLGLVMIILHRFRSLLLEGCDITLGVMYFVSVCLYLVDH